MPTTQTRHIAGNPSRRQAIIEAATAGFARAGYVETTVEQIARFAGVSGAAIYYHFGGKQQLFGSALKDALDGFRNEVLAERPAGSQSDLDKLRAGVRAGLLWWQSHPDEARLVSRYSEGSTARAVLSRRDWEQHHLEQALIFPYRVKRHDSAVQILTVRLILDLILDTHAASLPGEPLQRTSPAALSRSVEDLAVNLVEPLRPNHE